MKRNNIIGRNRNIFILVSLAVPIALLCLFVAYPALNLVNMSLTDWDGLSKTRNYIGLDNYITMLGDKNVLLSLRNNAIYFFVHLLMIPVELGLAVMLSTKMTGGRFFKSMTFMPYIINGVAISYTFAYFFSPINGGFNAILSTVGLEGWIRGWLSDSSINNFVLASVSVWRFSGYHIILFISALTSVPHEQLEAATIDGANAWHKFRMIQVPSIRLVIDFILFDNVRGALQVFEIPFIITSGGPGYDSSTFTLYTINAAFTHNRFGLASAMAVVIMLLIVLVYQGQGLIMRGARRRGEGRLSRQRGRAA